MAVISYVTTLLGGIDSELKRVLIPCFRYVLDNWRLGDAPRAQNAQLYKIETTTHAVSGSEFAVAHGLDGIPHWIVPVLNAHNVGDQLVPLTVTRAADGQRLYLSSTVASAPITIYVEPD